MKTHCLLLIIILGAELSLGQQSPSPPIADNSFLIEEAYNQEAGVVQHINTFARNRNGDFGYTFTQEWPVFSQKHQFSYTIPIDRAAEASGGRGFGDVALNYRYQLVSNDRVWFSPRASLLLPTGVEEEGLGTGGVGFQFNLPISTRLSRHFVSHTNAGATFTPNARNSIGEKAAIQDYFVGESIIWLAKPRFNVLVETIYDWRESVVGTGRTTGDNGFVANPGVRWAHNLPGGLQIVPGISVPIGVGPSKGDRAVFFYLSFEHSFLKQ